MFTYFPAKIVQLMKRKIRNCAMLKRMSGNFRREREREKNKIFQDSNSHRVNRPPDVDGAAKDSRLEF